MKPETLNHVVQQCYSTHGMRIHRHDTLTNYLARSLVQKGFTVHREQLFQLPSCAKLKPDTMAYSVDQVLVIDTQVINDQY